MTGSSVQSRAQQNTCSVQSSYFKSLNNQASSYFSDLLQLYSV